MYELLTIGYDSALEADSARKTLIKLSSQYLIDVADAAVAVGDGRHHMRLEHLVDVWPVGLSGRAIWGTLAGVLQHHPSVKDGFARAETLAEFGISDGYMEQVLALLERKAAVLFVLARKNNSEHVLEHLHEVGGEIADELLRSDIHRPADLVRRDPAGLGRSAMAA